jgi:hypothetical protein
LPDVETLGVASGKIYTPEFNTNQSMYCG